MEKTHYITKQKLEDEIIASKKNLQLHPDWTPAQCFTPTLTKYLMTLVDRYASKGNWRNYCVDEATQALTQRGWLNMDEINEKDIILSYHEGYSQWSNIKSVYRGSYNGKMFHLTGQGIDALVTPGHKFVTGGGLKPVEKLDETDRLVLLGKSVQDEENNTIINHNSNIGIMNLLKLSQAQRDLLIKLIGNLTTSNCETHLNIVQCNTDNIDFFVALCAISGCRTSVNLTNPLVSGEETFYNIRIFENQYNISYVDDINFNGSKNTNRNEPTVPYNGRIWCPETEFGSFVARRNGCVFLTGNSYLSDMKSYALVMLCQNCFKYDETRYDNPFGYLTQIVKYCFINFLEKEEDLRDIKDSLWESIDMAPSYTRQVSNEMMKDITDRSAKGIKTLKKTIKKDAEILNITINAISALSSKINKGVEIDSETDIKIAEILELEVLPYTSHVPSSLSLFQQFPDYSVEENVEIGGQLVNCLSVYDEITKSKTKRVISNTNDDTVAKALCSIGLIIRRDILVKELRKLTGYNVSNQKMPEQTPIQEEQDSGDEPRDYGVSKANRTKRTKWNRQNAN